MTRPDEVAHLRVPPHSVENEQALLGAVLNDNAQFTPVAARVPAAAWYRPDHRAIWQTITGLITADRVAENLLRAVGRGRLVAPISPESWVAYGIRRASPGALRWLLRRMGGRMRRELGSGQSQ